MGLVSMHLGMCLYSSFNNQLESNLHFFLLYFKIEYNQNISNTTTDVSRLLADERIHPPRSNSHENLHAISYLLKIFWESKH